MKRSKQPQTTRARSRILVSTTSIGSSDSKTTTTYWIGGDGNAGICGNSATVSQVEMVSTFASFDELSAAASDWPMRFLVDVWNRLPGQRKVARFENRGRALQRLWRALQQMPFSSERTDRNKEGKTSKESAEPRVPMPSKSEHLVTLLHCPGGATLTALMEASGWQAHTVRGFLSRKISKQPSLRLHSFRREGQRVYSLSPMDDGEESGTLEPHQRRS